MEFENLECLHFCEEVNMTEKEAEREGQGWREGYVYKNINENESNQWRKS